MAVTFKINGTEVELDSYSIKEEATPIHGGDTSGAISSFDVSFPRGKWNAFSLYSASVELEDPQYGKITGKVDNVNDPRGQGTISLNCFGVDGNLAVYDITAKPFSGTLAAALEYYIRLGHPTLSWSIVSYAGTRMVAYMGWTGELWYHLKQIAIAQNLEIAVVDNVVTFRAPRATIFEDDAVSDLSASLGNANLAQRAEAYYYRTSAITNNSVYPVNRHIEGAQIHSVPAGEVTEIMLELETSLSSVSQPTFRETIDYDWFGGETIFSLTTNDAHAVTYGEWARGGGYARLEIQEDDPTKLKLIIRGPTNVYKSKEDLTWYDSFTIAVGGTNTQGTFSSLRVAGTGVRFRKKLITVPTGVPASATSSESAPTIDNPFLNTPNRAYELCASLAIAYARPAPNLTANVVDDRALGNTPGSRVWDEETKHWYRARSVSYSPEGVGVSAEIDTTIDDVQKKLAGKTYDEVKAMYAGLTYDQVALKGLDLD